MPFSWPERLSMEHFKRTKGYHDALDETTRGIETVPFSIFKAELQAAETSLDDARVRFAALDAESREMAKDLKYTRAMALAKQTRPHST